MLRHINTLFTAVLLVAVLTALAACTDDNLFSPEQLDVTAQGDMRRVKIAVTEEDWRTEQVTVNQYGMTTRAGETMIQLKTNSARSWDFTRTSALDIAALAADAAHWTYNSGDNRYTNSTNITGAIRANGNELTLTSGLTISSDADNIGKIKIDVNKQLQLGGSNITLTIPNLKKGQTVTIEFAATGDATTTFDTRVNLSDATGFTPADKDTRQKGVAKVTADGDVTLKNTTNSTGINIYSISVSARIDEGFGLYSTRLGVDNSHVVWDPNILNWAGISNDFYLMLWPNNIIKYALTLNGSAVHSAPNYFTVTPGSESPYNTKFNSCTYMGTEFSKGFKLESSASIKFNSGANGNKVKVTIVQSTSDNDTKDNQIQFDGKALNLTEKTTGTGADPWVCTVEKITNGRVYVIRNVAPKTDTDNPHVITRNDGGPGIFYVSVDLDFTAYSPYVADGTFADGSTTYGVTDRDANSLTFMPHSDNRIDLLYGEDFTDNDGTVHLNFKHALGKLSIGTVTNDYGEPISLKQITLTGTKFTKGTMSLHTGEWSVEEGDKDDNPIVYQQAALEALFGSLTIPDKGSLVFPSYVNYQQIPESTITFEYLFENSAGKQLKVTKALTIEAGVNQYINIRVDQNHAVVLE